VYSAGIDFPGRVEDQLRNIVLAFVVMWFVAANVPPQMMMRFAVPIYVVAWRCWWAVATVRHDQEGRAALAAIWAS
jgi:rod shape determining protein RodA